MKVISGRWIKMDEEKMLPVTKEMYYDVKYALVSIFGEDYYFIPEWDNLKFASPLLGDCKGCIYFHDLIFSSRCQKCLRSNGIVDHYILTKKVD